MKLHGVDQLAASTLDHHLVATEIRSREQLETFRNAIELQAVVLPDAQDARRRLRIRAVDVFEDRIFRRDDADEAILVLLRPGRALLVLLELVERDHACAETQTDELMTAADRQHGGLRFANEVRELYEDRFLVIIEIAQRAAQDDRV